MEWNNGTQFGYDQIFANTQLDGYDAPYTTPYGEPGHRTMQTPRVSSREPIASYYETARRPYHSPDSSLIRDPVNEVTRSAPTGPASGSCARSGGGIPGPVGKLLDCGCGCRGAQKVASMQRAKNKIISGDVDINNIYMFFILILAIIVIVNGMNVKHLSAQVKMLSKAASRQAFGAPGPPAA